MFLTMPRLCLGGMSVGMPLHISMGLSGMPALTATELLTLTSKVYVNMSVHCLFWMKVLWGALAPHVHGIGLICFCDAQPI